MSVNGIVPALAASYQGASVGSSVNGVKGATEPSSVGPAAVLEMSGGTPMVSPTISQLLYQELESGFNLAA